MTVTEMLLIGFGGGFAVKIPIGYHICIFLKNRLCIEVIEYFYAIKHPIMLIILSPAKMMDMSPTPAGLPVTDPEFRNDAELLAAKSAAIRLQTSRRY